MNPRLAKLIDARSQLGTEINAILDLAHDEDREPNETENASIAEKESQLEKVTKQIELEERVSARIGSNNGTRPASVAKPQAGFQTLGEQLRAIIRVSDPANGFDTRLVRAAGTGANEQSQAEGGFLLQPEYVNELTTDAYATGVLASKVRRRTIGANSNSLKVNTLENTSRATGSRFGGLRLYWVEEGGLKTPSKPKMNQMTWTLKKLVGMFYATDELLEDVEALEGMFKDAFKAEFGFMLDDAIVNGLGAGMPLGLLEAPSTIVVAKESGQAANTVVLANVLKMYSRFYSRGKSSPAAKPYWLATPQAMVQLFQLTLGGTATVYGAPVFLPPNGAQDRPNATLLGIPILEIEHAAQLGTVGDLILTDLNEYLMVDKGGIKTASSIHVRFIYDETAFRMVYRCDGRPTWFSAITPYKDTSNTVSSTVALATRA
jgi:HK97 family phage major capsid protein